MLKYNDVKTLVKMLSFERAHKYKLWISLGLCLYNLSLNHNINNQQMMKLWDKFSKKSEKYKEGECKKRWNKLKLYPSYNEEILHKWAKKDNPIKYNIKYPNKKIYQKSLFLD